MEGRAGDQAGSTAQEAESREALGQRAQNRKQSTAADWAEEKDWTGIWGYLPKRLRMPESLSPAELFPEVPFSLILL